MLSSPRSAPNSSLFVKLLGLTSLGHLLLVSALFLSDRLGMQSISMSMKGGSARVSMKSSGSGKRSGSMGAAVGGELGAQPQVSQSGAVQSVPVAPHITPDKLVTSSEKEKVASIDKSKTEKKKAADNKADVKSQEPVKTKPVVDTPVYTELKKSYSKLATKKKDERVSDVKEMSQLKKSTKKLRSTADAPEQRPVETSQVSKASEQKAPQRETSTMQSQSAGGQVKEGGNGAAHGNGVVGNYPTSGAVDTEFGEFSAEEGAAQGDEIGQQLQNYFRMPPGFEGHEPINMSWDVQDGVVVYVSPQGSEPLVLYAAYKDAVLKCKYPRMKHRIKYVYTFC